MSTIHKPKDVLVEFLRTYYKEPSRTIDGSAVSDRHTNYSDTFSATAGQTDFTVTKPKLLCVNSVTINSTAKTKYVDYNIDLRNNKIVLVSGAALNDSVVVDYDYNTNAVSWIFAANPEIHTSGLARTDYPRVVVDIITQTAEYLGFNTLRQLDVVEFTIDIAIKEGVKLTDYVRINESGTAVTVTENVMNQGAVDILREGIKGALKRLWKENRLCNSYFLPITAFRGARPINYDNDTGIFRSSMDIQIKGFDMEEY
jgi:hypothetical protein